MKEPEPPKILSALGDLDTSVGGSAMLEFKMRGYPRPNMKWTKDGQPVLAGDRHKFIYPDSESVALIINKVKRENSIFELIRFNMNGTAHADRMTFIGITAVGSHARLVQSGSASVQLKYSMVQSYVKIDRKKDYYRMLNDVNNE